MSDILSSLNDVADALTNPSQHRTPRHTWPADRRNRNKIKLADHVVVLPGLLTQLHDLAYPLTVDRDGGVTSRAVPQSRAPGNPRALAAYLDIHIAVTRWTAGLELSGREPIESAIRQLLGAAPGRDNGTQRDLLSAMAGWLARCEQVTGWSAPDPILTVPCPVTGCGHRTLRVDLDGRIVRCGSCGARWSERGDGATGSLEALGQYTVRYRATAATAAEGLREQARRRKAALYGHPEPP